MFVDNKPTLSQLDHVHMFNKQYPLDAILSEYPPGVDFFDLEYRDQYNIVSAYQDAEFCDIYHMLDFLKIAIKEIGKSLDNDRMRND